MKKIAISPCAKDSETQVYVKWLKKRKFEVHVLHPEDEIDDSFAALILTGGADVGTRPERDKNEFAWFEEAYGVIPVLGICRGMQLANVARGGTLHQDIPNHKSVEVAKDGRNLKESSFHDITYELPLILETGSTAHTMANETFRVNSRHHQSVDIVGEGLAVIARSEDGTIEMMIGNDSLFVQWHPEREDVWGTKAETVVYEWLRDAVFYA